MLYKNSLLKIPSCSIDVTRKGKSKYLAAAQIVKDDRCGKVYNLDICKNETGKPLILRFFSDGKQYQLFYTENSTWKQSKISKALGVGWNDYDLYYHDLMKSSADTIEITRKYFKCKDSNKSWSAAKIVDSFIEEKRSDEAERAWDRKEEKIKNHMDMFPPLPKDINDYLQKDVFQGYIFVRKLEKGKKPGVCTCCGKKVTIEKSVKHKTQINCPKCGRPITVFEERFVSSIKNSAKVCVAYKVDGHLLVRWLDSTEQWCIEKGKPKPYFETYDYFKMLYLSEKGNQKIYSYDFKYVYPWGERWRKQNYKCYDLSYVYSRNLTEVFGKKYYNVDLAEELKNNSQPLRFLQLLDNLQSLPPSEYLVKMGMYRLASELDPDDLKKGRDFKSILGINPGYKQLYSKWNVSCDEHRMIKSSKEWVNEEDFLKVRRFHLNSYQIGVVCTLLETMSFRRFANYFTKQRAIYPRCTFDQLLRWYSDYISMSTQMEIDLSHKSIHFPKDIKIAHDRLIKEFKAVEMQIYDEQLKRASANLYNGLTEYKADGYAIVFPKTRTEFIIEGTSLNHCVGTQEQYFNNHLEGIKMIFFIRHSNSIDKPFVTMQVDMRKCSIIQIYGYGDRAPAPDVRRFAQKFVNLLKKEDDVQRRVS